MGQEKKYSDIIDLPYKKSMKRPHMSRENRAAQFAPFAAVVGHEKAVKETARFTDEKRELDETAKVMLDEKLQEIERDLPTNYDVEFLYFLEDDFKAGGKYLEIVGRVKKIDPYLKMIHLVDGHQIAIESIYDISLRR